MHKNSTIEALRKNLKAAISSGGPRAIEDAAAELSFAEVFASEETELLLEQAASYLESLLRLRQRRGAEVSSIKRLQGHIQAVKGGR